MSRVLRLTIGAAGDLTGHVLPALGLARALAARGHDVTFASDPRWRGAAEGAGVHFVAAPAGPGSSLAGEAREWVEQLRRLAPDVVVSDALTLAPALAAERAHVPHAILLPEVYPDPPPSLPPFGSGLLPPRSRLGELAWGVLGPLAARVPGTGWRHRARADLNLLRAELGLGGWDGSGWPSSPGAVLVATLPELEYPRRWPAGVEVTGPIFQDLPAEPVDLPRGDEPLVIVAPSTVKDPEGHLAAVVQEAFARLPVRLLIVAAEPPPGPLPRRTTFATWIDYSEVIPPAALVVCHGNHGTVARALVEGVPVLVAPAMPDDAEHGARVAWAGAGLLVPRTLLRPTSLELAARAILSDPGFRGRAREIAAAAANRDEGALAAAKAVERLGMVA